MDIETRRQKQQALIVKLVERKVRSRAKQLYETRGEGDGHALQDWVQAETEVVKKSTLAPLYSRIRSENQDASTVESPSDSATQNCAVCETTA